ncbi:unnamed protein product [Rhizophagus irregularis]|nr:unnamed protein product [Rhizophagus irregularis]
MNEANFVEVGGADSEKDDINYITTEINEDVSVKVGGADSEKDDINYKPPHNGKPITKIGISPEEKYLTGEVEIQEKTKKQTNVQTSGFISLLDILRPLLNNRIYDSIMAYYQEDCKTENLSKIVQDIKSIEFIIGTLNGSILDGNILNIKFKVLADKLERLNVHSFSLYADDINDENLQDASSFNSDKWKINYSRDEIEIKFLKKNNESRRIRSIQDLDYPGMGGYMFFKNNDILIILNDGNYNQKPKLF